MESAEQTAKERAVSGTSPEPVSDQAGVAVDPALAEKSAPRPAKLGPVGWARWFWRTLTSMKTALILLFLFALGSVLIDLAAARRLRRQGRTVFQRRPAARRVAGPVLAVRRVQGAVVRRHLPAAVRLLVGCVLPRTAAHLRELRRKPPAPPRNLVRLPQNASFDGDLTVEEAAARLRAKRFRVTTGPDWVAAEKGYLRETGNLVFHVALLGLLVAVGMGTLFGYRGNVLVVEGDGFANTVAAYDRYMPGQQVSAESLEPFSFTVDDFQATYIARGERQGQPLDFGAKLKVTDAPGARERDYELKVNEPLDVNGTLTYLIDHGYAPTFKITDGKGQVAFDGPVPCLVAQPPPSPPNA